MDTDQKPVEVKELLKDLYKDVGEWLKFAEAKNGILLTITGVLLFGLLRMLPSNNEWIKQLENTLLLSSFILTVSILIILSSYIPMLNTNKLQKKIRQLRDLNLLYYKDIATFTKEEYVKELENRYNITLKTEEENLIKDQVEQIISLSKIALRKYIFFNIGAFLVGISVFIILAKIFYTYLG